VEGGGGQRASNILCWFVLRHAKRSRRVCLQSRTLNSDFREFCLKIGLNAECLLQYCTLARRPSSLLNNEWR
jgi:hypothetical protein